MAVRSSGSYTAQNVDQAIPTIVAGDTFVYLGATSDGDSAHRFIDSAPTIGGVSMTAVPGAVTSGGQNNQVDVYMLANCAGGTNVTLHTAYHATTPGYLGAWYVVSDASTTQPGTNASDATSGTTPTASISSAATSDLILEIIASSASPTPSASQTIDFSGSGNGSSFVVARKTPTTGTNTETWSQSNASYALSAVLIKQAGGGGGSVARSATLMMMGV